ncbi:MAG TPA: hypothetical protein VHM01_14785 [Alphaproteobacteria bacterium]|nr:hypothetical protein [Alphaproteobacteria bacterium]
MSRSASRPADDVLFWAERAAGYYWGPFALATLAMLPVSTIDPVLVAGGLAVAAAICAANQHCFVFHLHPSHIALRGAMLDRVHRFDWESVREARAHKVRHAWITGNGARGKVCMLMDDGTCIRVAGVRDPEEACAAINKMVARHAARGRQAAYA